MSMRLAGMVLFAQMALAAAAWGVEVGEPVPGFAVQTLAGAKVSRESLAGKPMLIVFWNTWCSLCARELPQVSRVAGKFPPEKLGVLAINTGLNDSESKARAYWNKHGYLFPAAFDRSFEAGYSFRVAGVPTVFLVDSKGIVRYKEATLPDNLEERVRQLLVK